MKYFRNSLKEGKKTMGDMSLKKVVDEPSKPTKLNPLYLTFEPKGIEPEPVQEFLDALAPKNIMPPTHFKGDMTIVFTDEDGRLFTYLFDARPISIISGSRASDAELLYAKRVREALKDLNDGVAREVSDNGSWERHGDYDG
jgi:hypothetical protein